MANFIFPVYPAVATASVRRSRASEGLVIGGAKPPSSPMLVASYVLVPLFQGV
jgi:hypothetical protein